MRTSISHPLQIAAVSAGANYGLVGLTFCPGKKQPSAVTGAWDRDLGLDLDAVAAWNAAAVVTLLEPHELTHLGVDGLGAAVRARHIAWYHLPIRDVDVPDAEFERAWGQVGPGLRARLRDGANVLVHCKGGLGRAGMIAARLLIELGMAPDEAIAQVRVVRPGAIETARQLARVRSWGPISEAAPDGGPEAVRDRAVGALLGLALGDALGTARDRLRQGGALPSSAMIAERAQSPGVGPWSGATAMALALATSLIERKGFDESDLLERLTWWADEGEFSCTGTCVGMPNAVARALTRFRNTGGLFADPAQPPDIGGAALVRLAPVAIRYWQSAGPGGPLREVAGRQSRTTDADPASLAAAALFAELLGQAIAGTPRAPLLRSGTTTAECVSSALATGAWRPWNRGELVCDGSSAALIEAALWCIARSGSFAEALQLAADLDETGATPVLTGQLAGALYGKAAIPPEWLDDLAWEELLESVALELTIPWGWFPE
jgi:ADP-ribosyl-[dinitrogen reductase] hydrolase